MEADRVSELSPLAPVSLWVQYDPHPPAEISCPQNATVTQLKMAIKASLSPSLDGFEDQQIILSSEDKMFELNESVRDILKSGIGASRDRPIIVSAISGIVTPDSLQILLHWFFLISHKDIPSDAIVVESSTSTGETPVQSMHDVTALRDKPKGIGYIVVRQSGLPVRSGIELDSVEVETLPFGTTIMVISSLFEAIITNFSWLTAILILPGSRGFD